MPNLGDRPSNVPLPTGVPGRKPAAPGGQVAWPGAENFILPGSGAGGDLGPFNCPERFWLHAGASLIALYAGAGWIRYDYQLRLVVNGAYGNDLLGVNFFQKANSLENHAGNGWWGTSIEAQFYCEANTNYTVYLLSKSNSADTYYYQHQVHQNMWAYTVGEGVSAT